MVWGEPIIFKHKNKKLDLWVNMWWIKYYKMAWNLNGSSWYSMENCFSNIFTCLKFFPNKFQYSLPVKKAHQLCPLGVRKALRQEGANLPGSHQHKGQRNHVEVFSSHSCTVNRILLVMLWDIFWKHVTSTSVPLYTTAGDKCEGALRKEVIFPWREPSVLAKLQGGRRACSFLLQFS